MALPPNTNQVQYQSNNITIVPTVSGFENNKPMANVKDIVTITEAPTVPSNEKEPAPAVDTKAASAQSMTDVSKQSSTVDHVPSTNQSTKSIVHPVKIVLSKPPASSVDTSVAHSIKPQNLNQPQCNVRPVKKPLLDKPPSMIGMGKPISVCQSPTPIVNTVKVSSVDTSVAHSIKPQNLNQPQCNVRPVKKPLLDKPPSMIGMGKPISVCQSPTPIVNTVKKPLLSHPQYSSTYQTPTSIMVRQVQQSFPNQRQSSSIHQSPSQFKMQPTYSTHYSQPTGYQQPMINQQPTYSAGYEPWSSSMVYQPPVFPMQHQQQPTSLLYNQQYSSSMVYQQPTSEMEYQPATTSVMYQPPPSSIMYGPTSAMAYQPMSPSAEYQAQQSSMLYQPHFSSVVYQPQSSSAYHPTPYSTAYQLMSSSTLNQPPSSSMPGQSTASTAVPRSSHLPSPSRTSKKQELQSFSADTVEQGQKPTKTLRRDNLNENLNKTNDVTDDKTIKVLSWASSYLRSIGHNNTKPLKINISSEKNKMSQRDEDRKESNKHSLPAKEKITTSSKTSIDSKKMHRNEKIISSHFKPDVKTKSVVKKNPAGNIQKHKSSTEHEKILSKIAKLDKETLKSPKTLEAKPLKKSGNDKKKTIKKDLNHQYANKKLNIDHKKDNNIPNRVVSDQNIKLPQTIYSTEQNKRKRKLSESHDLKTLLSSPIRSPVDDYSPSTSTSKSHPDEPFDLRSKLSRVNRRIYNNARVEDSTLTKKPKLQNDLKITVENNTEHLRSPNSSSLLNKKSKSKTKCKIIKLIINVKCHESDNDTNSNDSSESENNPSHNTDLTFLDDFNIDEIVDSLKHSPKHKTKSPQPQINEIENDLETSSESEQNINSGVVQLNSSCNMQRNKSTQEEVNAEIGKHVENYFKSKEDNDDLVQVSCSAPSPYIEPISNTHSHNLIKMDLHCKKSVIIKTEDIYIDLTDDADEDTLNAVSNNDEVTYFDENFKRQPAQVSTTIKNKLRNKSEALIAQRNPNSNSENYIDAKTNIKIKEDSIKITMPNRPSTTSSDEVQETPLQESNTGKNELCCRAEENKEIAHTTPVSNNKNNIDANININNNEEVKSQSPILHCPSTNETVTSFDVGQVPLSHVSITDIKNVCMRAEENRDTNYKNSTSNREKDIEESEIPVVKNTTTGVTDTILNKLSNETNEESSNTKLNKLSNKANVESSGTKTATDENKIDTNEKIHPKSTKPKTIHSKTNEESSNTKLNKLSNKANVESSGTKTATDENKIDTNEKIHPKSTKPKTIHSKTNEESSNTKLNKISNKANEESSGTKTATDENKIDTNEKIHPKGTNPKILHPKTNEESSNTKLKKISNKANEESSGTKTVTDKIEIKTIEKKHPKSTKPKTVYPECSLTDQYKALGVLLESRMLEYLHKPFKITSLIRVGRHSNIFSCEDSNGQSYAAKVFLNPKKNYGQEKEMMLRKLQKDIPTENIFTLYLIDGFRIEKSWCILTEYYPQNLQNVLKELDKPFHIERVQMLAKQLISAVMVLRNNNIVHSDIKSTHILLNNTTDRLKLCGFDGATYADNVKALPNIGTPNYRAPEIILGISAGYSIDVWSTALVIYQMATKKKLYYAGYNNAILYMQMVKFGYIPIDMINASPIRDRHFVHHNFIMEHGNRWQNHTILNPWSVDFRKPNMLKKTLTTTYTRNWLSKDMRQRRMDLLKVISLTSLLEQMFVLDPRKRLAIEFVYVHPFIFDS